MTVSDLLVELQRIFFGDHSPWFLLEVCFRTVFTFGYTLMLIRWMGKRGMGQLSPFELSIIIALGAAVGDPMIYDDVPLVNSMIAIAVVVLLQRVLGWLTMHHPAVEAFVESSTELLVDKGRLNLARLDSERLSTNELFEMLRVEGVSHLGQVRQAFIEPSGRLSVIRWSPARPGLSVMPRDLKAPVLYQPLDSNWLCCTHCGSMVKASKETQAKCPDCGSSEFCIASSASEEDHNEPQNASNNGSD